MVYLSQQDISPDLQQIPNKRPGYLCLTYKRIIIHQPSSTNERTKLTIFYAYRFRRSQRGATCCPPLDLGRRKSSSKSWGTQRSARDLRTISATVLFIHNLCPAPVEILFTIWWLSDTSSPSAKELDESLRLNLTTAHNFVSSMPENSLWPMFRSWSFKYVFWAILSVKIERAKTGKVP